MYQALYRKYRPSAFSEVSGQQHITVTLKNQLKTGRISHAYLFTGSRGTGKTSCAKILAKAVNCLNLQDGDPCNECENCKGIDNGSYLDILEIDAASNNGVDNIRDLRESANFPPANLKYRVYIIDEVHMLSVSAFNALLKTLEEPPSHVIFILATTEVHKLPLTILSRCQRFDFRRIDPSDISQRINFIAQKEGFSITPDAAFMIGTLADGALRDALSILDLCVGHSKQVTAEVVREVCGIAPRDYLIELADYIKSLDTGKALSLIDQLHNSSIDMQRLCEELISHYRNLMIIKTTNNPEKLIVCQPDELEKLKTQAKDISLEFIMHAQNVLADTLRLIPQGNRRAQMEMAVIKLCTPDLSTSIESVLARIERLERAVKAGVIFKESEPKSDTPPAPESLPADNTTSEPKPKAKKPETAADPDNMQPFSDWPKVMSILSKNCPLLYGVLQGSTAYIQDDLLLIDSKNSQFRDLVKGKSSVYRDEIRKAAQEVTGRVFRLGPYKPQTQKAEESDPFDRFLDSIAGLYIPDN
ncbi:MAG TPA: DNA polymerase III subunit gamma/tau [Clostridiales bacterium]|nr:DNA polymerase III subunit gamma/tau [Clostridiales bacterium]